MTLVDLILTGATVFQKEDLVTTGKGTATGFGRGNDKTEMQGRGEGSGLTMGGGSFNGCALGKGDSNGSGYCRPAMGDGHGSLFGKGTGDGDANDNYVNAFSKRKSRKILWSSQK